MSSRLKTRSSFFNYKCAHALAPGGLVLDMGCAVINDIRKAYWINVNGDPFAEIDKNNERLDRAAEARREDMVRELSKDLRTVILKEY